MPWETDVIGAGVAALLHINLAYTELQLESSASMRTPKEALRPTETSGGAREDYHQDLTSAQALPQPAIS